MLDLNVVHQGLRLKNIESVHVFAIYAPPQTSFHFLFILTG